MNAPTDRVGFRPSIPIRPPKMRVLLPGFAVVVYLFAALFGPVLAGPAAADTPAAGSLSGTVRDDQGFPVPNVTVAVTTPSQLLPVTTDANGKYTIPVVAGGDHSVVATAPCRLGPGDTVHVDGNTVHDFSMPTIHSNDGGRNAAAEYFCRAAASFLYFDGVNPVGLTGDDASANMTLPFAFPFYGRLRTDVDISTNGLLSFGGPETSFTNSLLPNVPVLPHPTIAPFWDDLVVDSQAVVRTATLGSAPSRIFVVEWKNVLIRGTSSRITFEVQLNEPGFMVLSWKDIDAPAVEHGASATIGVQSDDQSHGMTESFDGATPVDNDTTIVIEEDFAPRANAGADVTVGSGASVPVDGSGTSDANNNNAALTFLWEQVAGPTVTITNRTKQSATITGVKGPATATFRLTAVDPDGRASSDTMTVTWKAPK